MAQPTPSPASRPATLQTCTHCGAGIKARKGFGFKSQPNGTSEEAAPIVKCFTCALRHGPLLRRSIIVALVVGTILTLLNQGDVLVSGSWDNALYWKTPLTYCVPFMVATYGALSNSRT
jgi:hypothetical protein